MSERLSGEIIEPFIRAMDDRDDLPAIQIMGGNGSAALKHPDTEIDFGTGEIHAGGECDLPRLRDDGTLRDVDILALTSDKDAIDAVHEVAVGEIGGQLLVEVFGLKSAEQLQRQSRQSIISMAKVFLGDRYIDEGAQAGFKALHPFAAPIDKEVLKSFTLFTPASERGLPTTHPGATLLNYLTRSISGLRPKDQGKITEIADNLLGRYPELLDWMIDGPGRDTYQLARILHTLRESKRRPQILQVGQYLQVEPYQYSELQEHPAFMSEQLSPLARRAIVAAAHSKSRGLHIFESNPKIVTFFQSHIEPRISKIVHND